MPKQNYSMKNQVLQKSKEFADLVLRYSKTSLELLNEDRSKETLVNQVRITKDVFVVLSSEASKVMGFIKRKVTKNVNKSGRRAGKVR